MKRLVLALSLIILSNFSLAKEQMLHVSFDVTRELFSDINSHFKLRAKIFQSHAGSGKQASSIMHGLNADVVTLALAYHVDLIADKGLIIKDWRKEFPNNSSPMSTKIVFLVRKSNPKEINDWIDLIKPGVKIIAGNPKTSGGALWNYIAAWIYASENFKSVEEKEKFIGDLYANVPILESSARSAAITFLKRKIGDVLITWESEARHIINNIDSSYQIVEPTVSVNVDIPIAVLIKSLNKELAHEYVNFLYSSLGQEIILKHYYVPAGKEINDLSLRKVEDFINWKDFKNYHFGQNGLFEKFYP
jgi:sulfate transport system substrate-binding protein